jgi:acyl-CoA synthetase (AMP-forming)/AMP-acid ligase II
MTQFNLADLFELVADTIPDDLALVAGERRLTYRELDERANRLAHVLLEQGVEPGDHVGLYLYNGSPYVEGMLAAYKMRAVPVNVNYRYVEDELVYLFDDAGLVAVICDREFCPIIADVVEKVPGVGTFLAVDDGSGADPTAIAALDYETELAAASPERDFGPRSPDDIYLLYTGGTTGMPKGVLWRHEDIFFAALGGGNIGGEPVESPGEVAEKLNPGGGLAMLIIAPLMHGAAQWNLFIGFFMGNAMVLNTSRRFEPEEMWRLVEREQIVSIGIVGDAMGRPLIEALQTMEPRPDTSSLFTVGSGGAIWSDGVKSRYRELLPNVLLIDNYGSSETGAQGGSSMTADSGDRAGPPRFEMDDQHTVFDDDLKPVEPGSGRRGRVARSGHIPLGYYGDEEKTAQTFVEVEGRRWVLQGDVATVEDDGTITMFGRGSVCINSGGEKIFPEEVEAALKSHPDVFDVVVVGVPDDRWGERVAAIVQARRDSSPTTEELDTHARSKLAGYKTPREVHFVDEMVRSPAGKADYRWAREVALGEEDDS